MRCDAAASWQNILQLSGGDLVRGLEDGVDASLPKKFFAIPQIAKFGGRAVGDSLSLGTKCWLGVGRYTIYLNLLANCMGIAVC